MLNPSPYLFYLYFPEVVLIGSSPEILVKKEGKKVALRPIAGTIQRGKTAEEDARLAKILLEDPKERAEHVMLVDLGRNDLGRVSKKGTVEVKEFMVIEKYSHVMHIVSHVEGELLEGLGAMDVLRSTFPAGTVSGAPKIRAMQIIEELEQEKRGPYAGAVGLVHFHGDMDMAIILRTLFLKDSTLYTQAGAGIVFDSRPEKEEEETIKKARASFKALEKAYDFFAR